MTDKKLLPPPPSGPHALARAAALLLLASSSLTLLPQAVQAQGVATENQLEQVLVAGKSNAGIDARQPGSSASIDAQALQQQNLFNAEDAAAALPSTAIRKRYLGDRNANVGGRSHGVLQPGRALVYLDGYLISNFLGRFDAPRWNMVNLEAIERIDAFYGPFSALLPGNSIGSTLMLTERQPKGFEASASLRYAQQDFSEYSTKERFGATQASARLAGRSASSGLWWVLGLQHQDSEGHPMGYTNAVRGSSSGAFATPTASATRVTGIVYDIDPNGRQRALFGANTIDHSIQDTLNLRVGSAIGASQQIEARVSIWRSDSTVRNETWLRDANGNRVWSGTVTDGTYAFSVPASGFAPSTRDELHRQLGATWKTTRARGWNASLVATQYRIVDDVNRQANLADPQAEAGGAGTVTRRDGTGWTTLEAQAVYKPSAGDWGDGRHTLTLGAHRNEYRLVNTVHSAADWRAGAETLNQNYLGRTRIEALYVQDAVRLAEDWLLTAGLREERFKTWDGSQYFAGPPLAQTAYPTRELSGTSPKLALAWSATDTWLLKASAGRGWRFPNVDELYNGTKTGSSITTSDPQLRPERGDAIELSAEGQWARGRLRISLFSDNVKDTIVRQTDSTVTPSITRVNNIDRVLSQGLELAGDWDLPAWTALSVSGSATFTDARIEANAANPATVGKRWLRIPPQRYTLQANWRPAPRWMASAAWRYSGRQYNTDTNVDVNPDTFGGTSRVNQLDVKVGWRFAPEWEWTLGIDNLNNNHAWQAHTMPQRVFHTALRWQLKGS
jgi:iron complex outermembrane receptor protein